MIKPILKNKFVIWAFVAITFTLILFVAFKPFKIQQPTEYNLTDYNLTDFEKKGCDYNEETYYTCDDGSKILDCFCDSDKKWDCLDDPRSFCNLGVGADLEEETESTGSITVSPNPATLLAPICFDNPCEVDTKFTVTSSESWYIDSTTGHATKTCGDAPGGSYWSICPTEGGAGSTDVIIKNRVYGVSTPADFDTLIKAGYGTWTLRLTDEWGTYVKVEAYMELDKV